MSTNNPPAALQIFRAGTHTAMNGVAFSFSEADLLAIANAYDPTKHEAPLVVGHPKHDTPAYGWVKSLFVKDGVLFAEAQQIDPAFAELVTAGRYKKISASFYDPAAINNPTPGAFALRHVGFLGAQPPAVKGLRNPSFSDDEAGVISFGDWDDRNNASLWRSLRDWFIGKFGLEEANKAIPGWRVEDMGLSAAQPALESPMPAAAFSETQQEQSMTVEQIKAENEQLKAALAKKEADEKAAAQAAIHAASVQFSEGLIKKGILAPKHKEAVVSLLDTVATPGVDGKCIEFGEGETKKPLSIAIKDFLSEMSPCVDFAEFATAGKSAQQETNPLLADADRRAAKK